MAVDESIEYFSARIFQQLLRDHFEASGTKPVPDKPLRSPETRLEVTDALVEDCARAVYCRRQVYSPALRGCVQAQYQGYATNCSDFLEFFSLLCEGRVGQLPVFEKILTTLAIAVDLCEHCCLLRNFFHLPTAHLCWAMNADCMWREDFYVHGGWDALQAHAGDYATPWLYLTMTAAGRERLYYANAAYVCGVMMALKNFAAFVEGTPRLAKNTASFDWVLHQMAHPKYEDQDFFDFLMGHFGSDPVDVIEKNFILPLKALCNPDPKHPTLLPRSTEVTPPHVATKQPLDDFERFMQSCAEIAQHWISSTSSSALVSGGRSNETDFAFPVDPNTNREQADDSGAVFELASRIGISRHSNYNPLEKDFSLAPPVFDEEHRFNSEVTSDKPIDEHESTSGIGNCAATVHYLPRATIFDVEHFHDQHLRTTTPALESSQEKLNSVFSVDEDRHFVEDKFLNDETESGKSKIKTESVRFQDQLLRRIFDLSQLKLDELEKMNTSCDTVKFDSDDSSESDEELQISELQASSEKQLHSALESLSREIQASNFSAKREISESTKKEDIIKKFIDAQVNFVQNSTKEERIHNGEGGREKAFLINKTEAERGALEQIHQIHKVKDYSKSKLQSTATPRQSTVNEVSHNKGLKRRGPQQHEMNRVNKLRQFLIKNSNKQVPKDSAKSETHSDQPNRAKAATIVVLRKCKDSEGPLTDSSPSVVAENKIADVHIATKSYPYVENGIHMDENTKLCSEGAKMRQRPTPSQVKATTDTKLQKCHTSNDRLNDLPLSEANGKLSKDVHSKTTEQHGLKVDTSNIVTKHLGSEASSKKKRKKHKKNKARYEVNAVVDSDHEEHGEDTENVKDILRMILVLGDADGIRYVRSTLQKVKHRKNRNKNKKRFLK